MVRGIDPEQRQQIKDSKQAILAVLADGDWHRPKNIITKSGKSRGTVHKYLREFLDENKIEKKVESESEGYGHPTYYRLLPAGHEAIKRYRLKELIDRYLIEDEIWYPDDMLLFSDENLRRYIRADEREELSDILFKMQELFFEVYDLLRLSKFDALSGEQEAYTGGDNNLFYALEKRFKRYGFADNDSENKGILEEIDELCDRYGNTKEEMFDDPFIWRLISNQLLEPLSYAEYEHYKQLKEKRRDMDEGDEPELPNLCVTFFTEELGRGIREFDSAVKSFDASEKDG